ncbi:MAG: DNA sulfur modification protein DndD [Bacteroidales bacterium]|nr:DNA sulfur modification protein DndD [Bacteroidales bacterium]
MIFNQILIKNFGLYKGENIFNLQPNKAKNKSIVLISGQNGVGKSTIQEAIHLCLLGQLFLDNRVSESQYEKYLYDRSHKGMGENGVSKIELNLNISRNGKEISYKISRSWRKNQNNTNEEITIIEDGQELIDINKREKNFFLREMIPPGYAKVIFFDGEKLSTIYENNNLSKYLKETSNYLFGLNFIELLARDLSYYENKIHNQVEATKQSKELKDIQTIILDIHNTEEKLFIDKKKSELLLEEAKTNIQAQEEEISKQGRWATKKLDKLKSDKQKVEQKIGDIKKELVEIYSHLGPFTLCKELCAILKHRLLKENEIEKWQHAQELLLTKSREIEDLISDKSKSQLLGIDVNKRGILVNEIEKLLFSKPISYPKDDKIYHPLSDSDRNKILGWIDSVQSEVHLKLKKKTNDLMESENILKEVIKERTTFSNNDIIKPLIQELQELNKKVGATEQKLKSLSRKIEENNSRRKFYESREESIVKKLSKNEEIEKKLDLSKRTQMVINEYARKLLHKKLVKLEVSVLDIFNRLCRKLNYFDTLQINPETFEITLSKNGLVTHQNHLSAGEKQLLILSILWGVREMTQIALPLVIDSPLSRLNHHHRSAFLNDFLQTITPQVILLGTEIELSEDVTQSLESHISHHYQLSYDSIEDATNINSTESINQVEFSK